MSKFEVVHGETGTRLHNIWIGMKTRCYNPNHHNYKDYGGRGIKICETWKNDYLSFANWSRKNGYSENLSIDRIDVNGDYSPENCRWVDIKTQSKNKRNNVLITANGRTLTRAEWAKETNIPVGAILARQSRGWSDEDSVTIPIEKNTHFITIGNETHSYSEWEKIKGLGSGTISTRIRRGWSELEAVTYPKVSGRSKRLQKQNK